MENEVLDLLGTIEGIVEKTDLSNVDKAGGREELPEGYYLCKTKNAEVTTSKSSGAPMFVITFYVEEAKTLEVDARGYASLVDAPKFVGKNLIKYYPIKEEKDYQKFVRDMLELKEGDNKPFNKEMFDIANYKNNIPVIFEYIATSAMQVYVHITGKENPDGTKSLYQNILKWDMVDRVDGLR